MSDAKAYAQRNQRGSDWFSHDSKSTAAAASPAHKAASEPACVESAKNGAAAAEHDTGRAQMIKPKCDSNQWFKHDGKEDASAAAAPAHPPVVESQAAAGKVEEPPAAGGAKNSREGDVYGRRDKQGTSASWFSHDHAGEAASGGATSRVVSKEGGDNANRMRGESENWFNYDGSKDAAKTEVHVSKGRTNRPQNNEMRDIFGMGK